MQSIRTRYFGPTDTHGSRIQAKCEAKTLYMPYRHELDIGENHKAACALLVKAMKWDTDHYADMVGGEFSGDHYWVFDDKRLKAIRAWVELTRKGTPSGNPWSKAEFRALVDCLARDQGFFGPATEWVDAKQGA
jgi:hypothetical protein